MKDFLLGLLGTLLWVGGIIVLAASVICAAAFTGKLWWLVIMWPSPKP